MNPLYYTFEQIEKDDKKLNVGKFSRILADFGIELPK